MTDNGYLYSVGTSGITISFGSFDSQSNASNTFEVYAGDIWMTNASTPYFGRTVGMTPGITYVGSKITGTGKVFMKTLLDNLYYSTGLSGNKGNHQINYFTASYLQTPGIDLGLGWNILGIENYNQQYLAISASYSPDGGVFNSSNSDKNFLFLWDGISKKYNRAIRIPGTFVEMKSINNELYFIIKERTKQYALYLFTGNALRQLLPIAIDGVKDSQQFNALFNYMNTVGVNLEGGGEYIIDENYAGSSKYILSKQNFNVLGRGSSDQALYGGVGAVIKYYNVNGGSYSDIEFRSNWVTLKRDLGSIEIFYEKIPPNCSIDTTIWGKDETGTLYPITLQPINSTTQETPTKTTLDVKGFTGRKLRIDISTTGTGSWQAIIRKIGIIYTE
jgi:hypothetical protein